MASPTAGSDAPGKMWTSPLLPPARRGEGRGGCPSQGRAHSPAPSAHLLHRPQIYRTLSGLAGVSEQGSRVSTRSQREPETTPRAGARPGLGGHVGAYRGQEQFTHSEAVARGEPPLPVKAVMLGKVTGKSSRGTGTGPHAAQWTMGMGVPQYRCRETSQSFSLLLVTSPPSLFARAF